MGILDTLVGKSDQEFETLRREVSGLRERLSRTEGEREIQSQNLTRLIEKTHAFLDRLKLLVGTLEDEFILERCWQLLDLMLSIKKGGIFSRSRDGWKAIKEIGFGKTPAPMIPFDEESMATFAVEQNLLISLAHLKKQDDLLYLERRGVIPDAKIVCPVRVRGEVQMLLLICSYGGNVFGGDDDFDLLEMVGTLLGLVQTNNLILQEQKKLFEEQKMILDQKVQEMTRLRNIFSRMVAPDVIRYIEQNPDGIVLGGIRQKVAVMFCDIRGFTRMSEMVSPEKVIELLNLYFTRVTEIVIKQKGTLDKFIGDCAMVLFGTPLPLENPSMSAASTALAIQDMVQDKMADWVGGGFPAFSVGIGIHYGEMVVGNVGSERLSNFTVIGDGVNLASRLCGIAGGGEIIVSESCHAELKDWEGNAELREGITVKGKSEPINVYALSRISSYEAGPCPKCKTFLLEGVRFCGSCGFRRF